MSKLIVITGVTGLQGSSVARTFLKEPGWRVAGITRDPSKPSNQWLRDAGVELVAADLDDRASLSAAFSGATAIFAMTDFWQFMSDPATAKLASERGIQPNQVAFEREKQQGFNLVEAAAATVGTLERFVLSTLSDSKKWSQGKINWNLHFDGKAAVADYVRESHKALAAKTSYVQVGFYFTNWKMSPLFAPQKQSDGTFVLLSPPLEGEGKKIPFVDPSHETGIYTRSLIMSAPANTTVVAYSELLTCSEYAALWSKVTGRTCRIQSITKEQAERMMPPFLAQEVMDSATYTQEYGWAGGDPSVVSPEDIGVDVASLKSVEEYIKSENWSQLL